MKYYKFEITIFIICLIIGFLCSRSLNIKIKYKKLDTTKINYVESV